MFIGGGHGEWLNKLWYIYSVTYSAAVKKISRTIHANMKRYKDLLLSEIKLTSTHMLFCCLVKNKQINKTLKTIEF